MNSARKLDDGFTLIELLVIILIIGILAAIALPTFLKQQKKLDKAKAVVVHAPPTFGKVRLTTTTFWQTWHDPDTNEAWRCLTIVSKADADGKLKHHVSPTTAPTITTNCRLVGASSTATAPSGTP